MKVLIVITKGVLGGAQRYVADLADGLSQRQISVSVVCGTPGWLTEELAQKKIRVIPIRSLGRDIRLRDDLRAFYSLYQNLKKERPDVIHLNSTKVAAMGAFLGRIIGISRIIVTVHGFAFKEERSVVMRGLLWFAQWLTALLSHQTIVISHADEKSGRRFPWCASKVTYIPNGIADFSRLPKAEARRAIAQSVSGGGSTGHWIGIIAELNHNKGIDVALEGFATIASRHQDISLFIIGSGVLRETLRKKAHETNFANRIHFIDNGRTPSRHLLAAFDIFLLPSRKEGLPYILLEAGKAALPVVASRVGGNSDIIEHGISGLLFPANNANMLSECLEELLMHPERCVQYGRALERRVANSFTLSQMLKSTVDVYQQSPRS